jgi:O-acetyl-ADP-ribose deacetylase (regulator of RNase III)
MITYIQGDITEIDCQYIAHQCNALHNRNAGLAAVISKKWPTANIYSGKFAQKNREAGAIIIRGHVIAMIAQANQGKPSACETAECRQKLFETCLEKISQIPNITQVAFPYKIGCGMAGGNWDLYKSIIEKWSEKNPHISVLIVCL